MTRKYIPIDDEGNPIQSQPEKRNKHAKRRSTDNTISSVLKKYADTFVDRTETISPQQTEKNNQTNHPTEKQQYRAALDKLEQKYREEPPEKIEPCTPLERKYWQQVNREQFRAIVTLNGPVLVIAGAGSGKTRTLVHRTAYMLEQNILPEDILLLTFTRRASQEIQDRVNTLIDGEQALRITAGTFHGVANTLLRKYALLLGISPAFTIADSTDSADIISIVSEGISFPDNIPKPTNSKTVKLISLSRNKEISIEQALTELSPGLEILAEPLQHIADRFHAFKRQHDIFDYDDLLFELYQHLETNEEFLRIISRRFRYIMIDEFQDTNIVQRKIADIIAKEHRNIMVVGDDSQSIYAFRGASIENILSFPARWPDCVLIKLEQNYRSQPAIIRLTNNILLAAQVGYRKELFSTKKEGLPPLIIRKRNAGDEAEYIADIIEERLQTIPASELAVLYRSGYHSSLIQATLQARGIPFAVYGGIPFTERRHIKDTLAFFKVITNSEDDIAWHRLLLLIPGIGHKRAENIVDRIRQSGLQSGITAAPRKAHHTLELFLHTVDAAQQEKSNPAFVCDTFFSYYHPLLTTLESDSDERIKDLELLRELAQKYHSATSFVSDLALDTSKQGYHENENEQEEKITLSTIHSAKGLEWHTVIIPHLVDTMFPSTYAMKSPVTMEEERRLFYVACSRAKEELILTFPSRTMMNGSSIVAVPSRFLREISHV